MAFLWRGQGLVMSAIAIWVCLLATATAVHGTPTKECVFSAFPRDDRIDAWEFQVKLPRSKTGFPFETLGKMGAELLQKISDKHHDINITIDFGLRVSKVFSQHGWSLTTYDGKKIYPESVHDVKQFPWTDGYLRKRQSILLLEPEIYTPTENGTCAFNFHNTDLTVKFRHIDMEKFDPEDITKEFPAVVVEPDHHVEAKLSKTVECDIYCNAHSLQYKAKFAPVYMHKNADNLEGLVDLFPGLAEKLEVPPCAPLPFRGSKYQREARWQVDVNGIVTLVTLTLEYKNQAKAFTGTHRAVGGEVSFRIGRKQVVDALGEFSYAPVEAVATIINDIHKAGWDYLRPTSAAALAWEEDNEDEGCGCHDEDHHETFDRHGHVDH